MHLLSRTEPSYRYRMAWVSLSKSQIGFGGPLQGSNDGSLMFVPRAQQGKPSHKCLLNESRKEDSGKAAILSNATDTFRLTKDCIGKSKRVLSYRKTCSQVAQQWYQRYYPTLTERQLLGHRMLQQALSWGWKQLSSSGSPLICTRIVASFWFFWNISAHSF